MSGADHLSARYTVGHVMWRDRVAIAHAPANAAMPYQLKKETRNLWLDLLVSVFRDGIEKVHPQQAYKDEDRSQHRTRRKCSSNTLLCML
jgi:hypothetical protein